MNTSDAHSITVGGTPVTPEPADALLWLDVETTGLDPNECSILEIGAICTSLDATREFGRYETVIHIQTEQLLDISLKALKMHTANGLLAACEQSGSSEQEATDDLADFIDRLTSEQGLTLHPAGTNIQRFDLPAINHLLEQHECHGFLANQLHYRAFDMTTIRLLWQSLGHNPYQHHQHGTHRVHDCLTRDITEYRTLRQHIKDHTA
ncbi:oligoribonuclease [Bifidobacterium saguini DSM 23967]|uniref:Oligoribonuclease n=2 Tax=Bifidobacterium saguini TaxID=762210 RepID=A0A087D6L6_9BIFI|nr:exonuclease domain-containing protein [Bifidobacterium saguini]KFI91166.1 oligoribonuclease [Bifidobacterium saguini DSM 23967]QTB91133.1 hypothetical protein BSD967_01415 [Bifidobacterium saguini]